MRTTIRQMGNSAGILLPKSVLTALSVKAGDHLSVSIEQGRLVLEPSRPQLRAGWAEAARGIAAEHDDALVWPEFSNTDDDELVW